MSLSGSTYTLNYLIDREALHAGRNFGKIRIHGVGTELTFEVKVHGGSLRKQEEDLKRQHQEIAALYECYMDFRLKRIQAETWVERSLKAWEEYTKAGGTGTMMELDPYPSSVFCGKRRGGLLTSGPDGAAAQSSDRTGAAGIFSVI
ncbi:MAG: DUF5717 family protein [Blautia sp.]